MFPSPRAGGGVVRRAVLVVVPVVIGAAVLLTSGDGDREPPGRIDASRGAEQLTLRNLAGTPSAASSPTTAGGSASTAADLPTSSSLTSAPASSATPQPAPPAGGRDPAPSVDPPPVTSAPAGATTTSAPAPVTTRPPEPTTTTSTSTSTSTTTVPVRSGPARVAGAEAEVVPLTNRDRASQDLGTLSCHACLDAVASGYAESMARNRVLAHNPGAGPAVTGCRANATWGDNVGTAAPCDTALLEERWMASPSHRRNILTGAFQLIGVGAWTDEQGGCWVQVLFST